MSGLLLQRFAEIGSLAQLVEEPRVLDGDDGLRGEVLHQRDLFVGERAHVLAVDDESPDQITVLEIRTATCDRAPPRLTDGPGVPSALGRPNGSLA